MGASIDITVRQAVDYLSDVYQWVDGRGAPSDTGTGLPVDLTGSTALMKVRASMLATSTLFLTLTDTSGITLGGSTGEIQFAITHTQTASMQPGTYYYDLLITDLSGVVWTVLYGQFLVISTVSQ